MALHSIIENIVLDDSDGLIKIRDGATLRQFADVSAITAAVLAALPYKTAVVDIGPTTNTGQGDQTKGILDWSANQIKILDAPVAGKFIRVIAFGYQYKAGSSAYVDPAAQGLTLFSGVVGFGTEYDWVDLGTIANYKLDTSVDYLNPSIRLGFVPNIGADPSVFDGQPLSFGDVSSSGELTTGNGQLRIFVGYAISDILV